VVRRALVRFVAVGLLALALMVAGFVGTAVAAKFGVRPGDALREYGAITSGISRATGDNARSGNGPDGELHSQAECPPPFTVSVGVLLLGDDSGTSRCYDTPDTP
jgi:hypothetical protein